MLMALFQNKESLSSNKTTRLCGQADKNVQLQARPRGLIGVRRKFNLLLHPIVIRRLTVDILIFSPCTKITKGKPTIHSLLSDHKGSYTS